MKYLDALPLIFEHLVQINGNQVVRADTFRAYISKDTSFKNGITLGKIYAYTDTALNILINSDKLNKEDRKDVEEAIKKLNEKITFDNIADVLSDLNDKNILF